ncbi:MAG: TetR/AcrR family transcriptional regulator [Bacteroidales bacterium]
MSISSNKKNRKILETAKTLFWKHGFKRVTVEEICSQAGISKMTFYKYYSNKLELVKTIILKIGEESLDRYREIMHSNIPFKKKIEQQLQMKQEGTAEMSSEFLDDLMIHADPEIMQFMSERRQYFLDLVLADYVKAQKKGEIRKDVKPEFILYFLNHMNEMIQDEMLIKMYKDPSELALELMRFFFYGVTPRNDDGR